MKFAVLVFGLLAFSLFAHAEMSFTGAGFAPSQCGPQLIDTAHRDTHVMQAACVGFVTTVGLDGTAAPIRAVQFTMSDDTTFLFRVTGQTNLFMAVTDGGTVVVYHLAGTHGETLNMRAVVNADNTIRSLSGNFQTNDYSVPSLEQMVSVR